MISGQKLPPLLVIVGETASGKSALALELAGRFGGELVCADSWTVYRDFDIGTAKPTAAERARLPHHLLDIADPLRGFSAVEFQRQARTVIDDIAGRGRLPIMAGGTGLYIDSVLFDYQFLPAPPAGTRERLNMLSLEELRQLAHSEGLDTTGIDLRNKRRVIRLIENDGVRPAKRPLRANTLVIGIRGDREQLRQRVGHRVDAMLAAGLEAEVAMLAARYGWEAEPMKGIGYREWRPYFQSGRAADAGTHFAAVRRGGTFTTSPAVRGGRDSYQAACQAAGGPETAGPEAGTPGTQSLARTRERIIAATMGLAKRQRTWFKRNDCIQWVETPGATEEAVDLVTSFLRKQQR